MKNTDFLKTFDEETGRLSFVRRINPNIESELRLETARAQTRCLHL